MGSGKIVVPKDMEGTYSKLHFAPAVIEGDKLYCSGVVGMGPGGKLPDRPGEQFRQAFENLKALLEAAGSSLDEIIEMTTFHVDFGTHIGAFMTVKDDFIHPPYPAWTAIGVSELAFGALVEIKVVAKLAKATE